MYKADLVFRKINVLYYTIYTLVILFTVIGYFINFSNIEIIESDYDFLMNTVPYIFIGITIIGLIVVFIIFELIQRKLLKAKDKTKGLKRYINIYKYRLLIIGLVLVCGIPLFYLTRNIDTLYCIGVAALALILSKPNENKISENLIEFDN